MTSIVFDGVMLSECQFMGNHRTGLQRVAEEVTKELVKMSDMEFYFANTIYFKNFHHALVAYIRNNFPEFERNIITKEPSILLEFLKFKAAWVKYPGLLFIQPSLRYLPTDAIFHSFYYPFASGSPYKNLKRSITFYDLIPIKYEKSLWYIRERTKKIVKSAETALTISISEFSRNELLNYSKKIKPENVIVAPLAASHNLFYPDKTKESWQRIQVKYNLPDTYFLCTSSMDSRKNIEHTIKGFLHFIQEEKLSDAYLVMIGSSPARINSLLDKLNISPHLKKQICIAGLIDEEDMAAVYSYSIAYLYLSEYEGFGLPALEAMQCGVPVVAADNTSVPEVLGNAGILISPFDLTLLADSLRKLYYNNELRVLYSESGLQRAQNFSWARTAEIYKNALTKY